MHQLAGPPPHADLPPAARTGRARHAAAGGAAFHQPAEADDLHGEACAPNADAELKLPNGKVLRKGQEIVTYVSRNLEPYRGFPVYMKVLERLCRERGRPEGIRSDIYGRNSAFALPPAQIPACGFPAPGSSLRVDGQTEALIWPWMNDSRSWQ